MNTKIKNLFLIKWSLILLIMSTTLVFAAVSPAQLATSVIVPGSVIDSNGTFIIDVGLQNPSNFSGKDVTSYFGHYYIPDSLEFISSNSSYCGRLYKVNQVSCSLYALGNNQTVLTESSGRFPLQFKLKDPTGFCAGSNSIKTIDAGIFSIDPQTKFTPSSTNLVQVQCGVNPIEPPSNGSTAVSFKLLDTSYIYLQDSTSTQDYGGFYNSGRYAGLLNFELSVTNTTSQPIAFNEMTYPLVFHTSWLDTNSAEFLNGMRQLSYTVMSSAVNADSGTVIQAAITNFPSECTNCSNGTALLTSGYKFNLGTINPSQTKRLRFSYNIVYRSTYAGAPVFQPRFLCHSRMILTLPANAGALDALSGWTDGYSRNPNGSLPSTAKTGDSVFQVLLNTQSLPIKNPYTGAVLYNLTCSDTQRLNQK